MRESSQVSDRDGGGKCNTSKMEGVYTSLTCQVSWREELTSKRQGGVQSLQVIKSVGGGSQNKTCYCNKKV